MNRRLLVIMIAVLALVGATAIALYARSASAVTPTVIAVAGDVRADENVVRAPAITQPTPDFTVGITTAATAGPKKRTATAGAPSTSRTPVVSGFLSQVLVTEGTRVTAGQVLALFDTTMLDLGVAGARAAADKARADLDVLEHNVSKLVAARAKLRSGRRKLVAARASLVATVAVLSAQRASLETSIAVIETLIAQPGGPPPHVPPYPVLLTTLRNALAQLKAGLAGTKTGLATIDANLAKMTKGLAQTDSGLHRLRDARELLEIDIESRDVASRLAEARRASATITSPVSGTVTFAHAPGTTVMVGAPVARIRPDGATRIDTYLTTGQVAQVSVGSPATVTFDSDPGAPLTGHVVALDDAAVVPPTGFPTAIVHMTRAVRVTIELDGDMMAPAGTPVDIDIRTGPAS